MFINIVYNVQVNNKESKINISQLTDSNNLVKYTTTCTSFISGDRTDCVVKSR